MGIEGLRMLIQANIVTWIVALVCATLVLLDDSEDATVGLCGMALFLLSRLWMVVVFDMRPVWYDMRRRGCNFLVTYLPVFWVRRRDSSASFPRYLGSTGTYDIDSFESAL